MNSKKYQQQHWLNQLRKYGLNPNHWKMVDSPTKRNVTFLNIKEPWLKLVGLKHFQKIEEIQWAGNF